MRPRRLARKLMLAALGIAYAGIAIGLLIGYDSRDLIDGFRGSVPQPSYGAKRNDTPRADDFWADQGQPRR